MAKGNLFLGQARGRVGSVVFARRKGVQVSRSYNNSPSNPQTRAQALQRAQFSTVIAFSQAFKEIVNNSFDGYKNGQDSVNAFVSENLKNIRARSAEGDYIANEWLTPKGAGLIQPQPYIISKGSIGIFNRNLFSIFAYPDLTLPAADFPDLSTPVGFSGKVLSEILYYKPGCQLTFTYIDWEIDSDNILHLTPRYYRVVFNEIAPSPTDNTTPVIIASNDRITYINKAYIDLTKSTLPEGSEQESSMSDYVYIPSVEMKPDSGLTVASPDQAGYTPAAAGIITTYLEESGFRHTRSVMSVNADAYDYTTDAVATYMKQATASKVISSDYYTEQPVDEPDYYELTLEDAVSAVIQAQGLREKGVFLGQSNSYGPVAEGDWVRLICTVPAQCRIERNSVKAYNGETPLGNDWVISRLGSGSGNGIIISGPMPTTTSFPFNASFKVYDDYDGSTIGTAALRINVTKANT